MRTGTKKNVQFVHGLISSKSPATHNRLGSACDGTCGCSNALAPSHQGPADIPPDGQICARFSSLLVHTKIESTVRYLGIEVDDTSTIPEQSMSELLEQGGPALSLARATNRLWAVLD